MKAIMSGLAALIAGITGGADAQEVIEPAPASDPAPAVPPLVTRERMVAEQILRRGVGDSQVLAAMRKVPRDRFLPPDVKNLSYDDRAIPIGYGQTISQPYVVAFMTDALDLKPTDKVLEIGTGSGYQAAILAELVKEVYTIEIIEPLGTRATGILSELGYKNVNTRIGDGYRGWNEAAPFDAIIVTCSPDAIPQPLIDQLAEGGRMIIPVGPQGEPQQLVLLRKSGGRIEQKKVLPVVFVPMTGEVEKK